VREREERKKREEREREDIKKGEEGEREERKKREEGERGQIFCSRMLVHFVYIYLCCFQMLL
jgi:hypothetical protein